jgi:low temperature requirement protein LtrA
MSRMGQRRSLRRSTSDESGVSPLELFFDLVFVFALAQLSHHLLEHQTWRGAAETLVLLVPVFLVWLRTAWTTTLLDTELRPVQWMLLLVMMLGLFMSAAIGTALEGSAWLFAGTYLAIQLGRDGWLLTTEVPPFVREYWQRILVWTVAGGPLWLAGAFLEPAARLLCWAGAAAVDLVGTVTAHPLPGRVMRSRSQPVQRDRRTTGGRAGEVPPGRRGDAS